jgi:D-alanyl-D-alanine carboxypeptidase
MNRLLAGGLLLAGCTAGSNPEHDTMAAAIDSIAATALERGPIAGLSIGVMRGSEMVFSRGYGFADLAAGEPATADTRYDIASITKLLTAVAIMRLVDDGQLSLDDDLAALLPASPNAEQARRITVRHMLSHTSGLHDYESADTHRWLTDGTPLTEQFVFELLRDRPLDFEPGTDWSYSNTGFYFLALIIDSMTGDYGRFMREEVALPLGMTQTTVCTAPLLPDRITRGYDADEGALVPGTLYMPYTLIGDGGMCSTVGDLARLPAALREGGVVSAGAYAHMREPTVLADGVVVDYGLGVRRGHLAGRPMWGHTGGMSSYWAVLVDYPDDDVTIVVLVNTDRAADDAMTIEGDVARVVLGLGEPALLDLPLTDDQVRAFSGVYGAGGAQVRIVAEGGRLYRARTGTGQTRQPLLYQGDNTFGQARYPMDRYVFHAAGDSMAGLSEYYNGIFAVYRKAGR